MNDPRVGILGPPGAGKGTQAARLASEFDLEHIETGAILRENKDMETPAGTPREYMDRGEYVPDSVMNALVEEILADVDGFVLDGYPRTQTQVEAFDSIPHRERDAVLFLRVDEETLVDRLTKRRVCDSCGAAYHLDFQPPREPRRCDECGGELVQRDDDTPEAITTRVREYMEKTEPIVDEYRRRGVITEIDGERPPDAVWDDIRRAVASGD